MKLSLNKHVIPMLVVMLITSSCVKKKDFLALQGNRDSIQAALDAREKELKDLEAEKMACEKSLQDLERTVASQKNDLGGKDSRIQSLEEDVSKQKAKNEAFLNSLSDLSLLSESETQQLKATLASMEGIPSGKARKDSVSIALMKNLKKSLGGSDDIQIVNKGSVVYITLSDDVLFNSGRATLNENAKFVLSKVAKVLKDHSGIDVLVEGHTDSDPIRITSYKDNWDLSIKRAVAVVRSLQKDYEISPARLIPTGKGEYKPKGDNETPEGKKINRRTEIILVPKVDQYLRLITRN